MNIEELGYQKTPLGDLTLRRRLEPLLQNQEVFEVKLGEEYLMSSLFTESERQLATLGLAPLEGALDVVVGGLGLGYTAAEVLKDKMVSRLLVIDLFQPVIDWHQAGLVPLGRVITGDRRCELRQGDFFELARTGFDAVVLREGQRQSSAERALTFFPAFYQGDVLEPRPLFAREAA